MPSSFGLVVVMKFQDKFASLQLQLNSPSSRDKFQIIMLYRHVLILLRYLRILQHFACFSDFCGISRIYLNFTNLPKYQNSWYYELRDSCTLYILVTKHLHLATIFLQLVTKRRLEDFFWALQECIQNLQRPILRGYFQKFCIGVCPGRVLQI